MFRLNYTKFSVLLEKAYWDGEIFKTLIKPLTFLLYTMRWKASNKRWALKMDADNLPGVFSDMVSNRWLDCNDQLSI